MENSVIYQNFDTVISIIMPKSLNTFMKNSKHIECSNKTGQQDVKLQMTEIFI